MRIQVIRLSFKGDEDTVYVDQAGTEDAAESMFVLQEHLADGCVGTIEFVTEKEQAHA